MKRTSIISAVGWTLVAGLCGVAAAQDAAPQQKSAAVGKMAATGDFPLTSKNGPWMVMVKSFKGPDAAALANKLAKELRDDYKIAAYTVVYRPQETQIQQVGMTTGRVRQDDSAAVLAGDCKDHNAANKLQDKIHVIRPKTITRDLVPAYQWQYGALRTAFCLPNPLADKKVEPKKDIDPLLLKLNSGKHNIFTNPGAYTLQAVTFNGGTAYTAKQAEDLKKNGLLEAAGEHAEQVAAFLRTKGIDAYTVHTKMNSYVTIGAFGSPEDPQIQQVRKQVGGMKVGSWMIDPNAPVIDVPRK